jgi:hypothetical protein
MLSLLDLAYKGNIILIIKDLLLSLRDKAKILSLTFKISLNYKDLKRLAS